MTVDGVDTAGGQFSIVGGANPYLIDLEGLVLSSANTLCYDDPEEYIWEVPELRSPIEEKKETMISIFPNPIDGSVLTIKIEESIEGVENKSEEKPLVILSVELYSINGQVVGKATRSSDGSWQIPTDRLADGVYFVRITSSEEVITRQIRVLR